MSSLTPVSEILRLYFRPLRLFAAAVRGLMEAIHGAIDSLFFQDRIQEMEQLRAELEVAHMELLESEVRLSDDLTETLEALEEMQKGFAREMEEHRELEEGFTRAYKDVLELEKGLRESRREALDAFKKLNSYRVYRWRASPRRASPTYETITPEEAERALKRVAAIRELRYSHDPRLQRLMREYFEEEAGAVESTSEEREAEA